MSDVELDRPRRIEEPVGLVLPASSPFVSAWEFDARVDACGLVDPEEWYAELRALTRRPGDDKG